MASSSPPAVSHGAPGPPPTPARRPSTLRLARPRREALLPGALTSGLWWSLAVTAVVSAWVLFDLGGWRYYTTPQGVRGYLPLHRLLRPTGAVAHLLGVAGAALMLVPVAYMVRKRTPWLHRFGSHRAWLELHIFCGVVGPVLVTFHTALKFNGLISVAYWFMVAVAVSGFIGRYLYVRIPHTIRGVELTHDEIVARAAELGAALETAGMPPEALRALERYAETVRDRPRWPGSTFASWRARRELRHCRRAILADGTPPDAFDEAVRHAAERAALTRRLKALQHSKRLFGLWHVFHLPLVWVMFTIVALHVGLALYLGYWPFHWTGHP